MRTSRYLWCVAAVAMFAACDTPLDTNPTDSIDAETALTTPRGIELGVNGAYRALQVGSLYGVNEMVYPDLYADNLDFTGTYQTDREVSLRNISARNTAVRDLWAAAYEGINRANNLLAAIPEVSDLTAEEQAQYRGEALFIRALNYSILVRYFGDVPILTEPSRGVGEKALVGQSPAAEVYDQIQADLEEAATLLPTSHENGRATQAAANALLARTYLESGEHPQARDKAAAVIARPNFSLPADFRSIFTTKNSSESIFELQYSVNNSNSQAFWFFPQALGGRLGYSPSQDLYDAYEAGDERRDASIGIEGTTRYGNKYFRVELGDDNVIVLRLAEMYLIRAEANARLNADPTVVRADIDVVRNRAGLANLPATVDTQAELLDAILRERRVEFAMEGHRFFDLRRIGVAMAVLGIPAERLLFPIPQDERDVNSKLGQNPGY